MTEVRGGLVKIIRNMSSKSYPSFIPIYRYMVSVVQPADQDSTPWRLRPDPPLLSTCIPGFHSYPPFTRQRMNRQHRSRCCPLTEISLQNPLCGKSGGS